ncbi:MAG TPA: Mrp/NBP35 family ATP-binding protein [Vicinamibacterales bacterium]|jgi:ATP-binding protein involved in chromosome partitioning|nr:Mrp/NBP35 family ATP-binding protein [Vicinamibacterales bacterium]
MVSEAQVVDALRGVIDPSVTRDIVSAKFVKDIRIDGGRVSFTIEQALYGAASRQGVGESAGAAVKRIPGVSAVEVTMTAKVRPAVLPDLSKQPVPGVKNTIAVGAGKGGVGKTTVSVNLAVALSQAGARVAMIDGDVYGPNVPIMLGIHTELGTDGQRIVPAVQYGIQLISMAFLTKDDTPVIWRGPMLHGVIQQFFREAVWDDVDYLIVDLPPGTGDIALSLSQTIPVAGAVVVTTPQTVSVADTRRAIRMYEKLNVAPLGLVENMSHFVCQTCHTESDIFGKGGGESLATEMKIPFLGRIPIYEPIRVGGDTGVPIVIGEPKSPAAQAFRAAAEQLATQIAVLSLKTGPKSIPLTQVR